VYRLNPSPGSAVSDTIDRELRRRQLVTGEVEIVPSRIVTRNHVGIVPMTFFGKLLGSSQREIWERLCEESGAEYSPGGFLRRPRVRKRVKNWTVTLDAQGHSVRGTTITMTRLQVPFVSTDRFRFAIQRKSVRGMLGKPIGRYYITCGHPDFDVDFWINSRDESKARALLDDQKYRRMFQAQPRVWLKVKNNAGWFGPKFPDNVDLLVFVETDIKPMTDVARLKSIFELMGATLELLCRIGSATDDDPGVVI
jgi:hypothetical protein